MDTQDLHPPPATTPQATSQALHKGQDGSSEPIPALGLHSNSPTTGIEEELNEGKDKWGNSIVTELVLVKFRYFFKSSTTSIAMDVAKCIVIIIVKKSDGALAG